MEFYGKCDEYLLVSNLKKWNTESINKNKEYSLSVFWNKEKETNLIIDSVPYVLQKHQMFFLTEFHKVEISTVNDVKIIRFNRNFYCLDNHDSEIGCKGVLFFGTSQVPMINLSEENQNKFDILWQVFKTELKSKDELQVEMLRMLLKRFLILATRIYKEENQNVPYEDSKLDVIRDFNYLVELHFKSKHTVKQYAELMNKPAKSLTNLFAGHIDRSPLQIIQDRIMLEAKRILLHSEKSIKEIAYDLGFDDIQSFSRFFKNKQGISPKSFKEKKHHQEH